MCALFSTPSFIQHSCRPSFHDTPTSGTREIICMSLKRCHDLTYRAEKTILVKNLQGVKEPESFNTASYPVLICFRKGALVRQTGQKKITVRNTS